MHIQVTGGPSVSDPADMAPITVAYDGQIARLAAKTLRSRLAVWLLRNYVCGILAGPTNKS